MQVNKRIGDHALTLLLSFSAVNQHAKMSSDDRVHYILGLFNFFVDDYLFSLLHIL